LTVTLPNGERRQASGPVTIRDRQKPTLTKAKVKPSRFKPSKKRRKGANLTYTLSEPGTITIATQHCTKKRRGRCRRYKTRRGAITAIAVKGPNSFHLTGYAGRKRLARGSYRLVLAPTDLVGNRGKVARAAFAIKK
jgi:hypothetical protein